jgi:hypothetical protein
MDRMEGWRTDLEALRGQMNRPGAAPGAHHDAMMRYLGALYYESRRGRARPEEVEQAVAQVDELVRAEEGAEPPRPPRAGRRWWSGRPRTGS